MNALKIKRDNHGRRAVLGAVSVLLLALLLAACGRGEPSPATSRSEAGNLDSTPAAGTVPSAPTIQPTVALTSAEMQIPVVTLEPTPVTIEVTPADLTGTDPITAAPLVVAKESNCQIESDLDLAGYAGVEEMMGCPLEVARFDPVGIEEFGDGPDFDRFMLWFSWEDQIYVLFPDGSWRQYPDTWQEGDPTFTCNPLEGEATSPPLPRRGFGKLWCQDAEVQTAMGVTPREERLCQHTVVQRFEKGRILACFEDATVRYFRIMDDQAWWLDVQ